ncbi:sensor histidine kinase [Kordiimonas aquimaris]|uniref:sensor histidine kinase n=1 Tax=Kordiimonas aquimaris TaxID=707591 RepID=UPI0021D1E9C1|nr:ATP-binding protein [Kordiimonas aquimaris]
MNSSKRKYIFNKDLVIATSILIIIFILFHFLDAFEGIYKLTREYEHLELDEYVLLILSIPIPLAWMTYRKSREAKKEFDQRIALEQTLARLHRMEALGTLAGGMAHELNNQLLPIISMSEMLRNGVVEDDPNYRKLELIFIAATNAKQTVSRVLEFSSGTVTNDETSDVAKTLDDTKEMLEVACPENIGLHLNMEQHLGHLNIASDDLQSIIVNPVVNAINAIGKDVGSIIVDVSAVNIDNGRDDLDTGKYIKIVIRDNGPGMSSETAERIFDPFFTTKAVGEGVGLGMAIVYRLVKSAGGKLFVSTEQNKGCHVTIYIPKPPLTCEA